MVKKKFKVKSGLIYILFLFIFLSPIKITTTLIASAQEKDQSELRPSPTRLELSLEDCLLKALRNNLSLKAEMITPQIADKNVTLATEKFMPSLNFNYNKQSTETASYSFLDASDMVVTKQNDYTVQLTQNIPIGGTLTASLNSYVSDSNRNFQTINPRYGSTLRLNFSQSLLRDFGLKYGRRDIIIAGYSQEISEENFQKTLEETIYNVELAYWNLVYARENLKVRQQSLKLAQELLEKNKIEIEAGTLPPIELLTAESEVSTRQADILEAEALVKNYEDQLKMVINLGAEMEDAKKVQIIPVDSPSVEKREISYEEAMDIALQKRPDLEAIRTELKSREFNFSYAKNQLMPNLQFTLGYWSPGISGDQLLYKDDNPMSGVIIGKIPGKKSDALKDAFNFKYKNWSIGLVLTLPLSNVITRANYAQAKLNLEQSRLKLKNQQLQLDLEIANAVRAVETNYQRALAYRTARELAEQKLTAEEEKFKVGMSTNYLVLQYQRDLANAQTMELKALIDYNVSLANLDRVMGAGRDRQQIYVMDQD
ncbi:MAG TPA: TolC family protein [Candidatus Saccharicenans sp.]|jgi:outer membrane protein TolC|nr:TolC family protein [Candidatus Saccharicenans sp.]HOJ26615.1 TolC family protein [Candidatus Saccharicenans sp.]HOM93692.1 TolC family protein [Candidatus Saccharicenans sp.]HOT68457.1 TolC family protein [Candidatus Saccharicenans sp.]HPC87673.1 TolC family protein [Candidatus Saccharicenans sp.]